MQFQKISIHPPWKVSRNCKGEEGTKKVKGGGGGRRAEVLSDIYGVKFEFLDGCGVQNLLRGRGHGYFLEAHNVRQLPHKGRPEQKMLLNIIISREQSINVMTPQGLCHSSN